MNEPKEESEVASLLLEIRDTTARLDRAEEMAEQHLRAARLATLALKLRKELEADVKEGSVESLLRAKEKLNAILDTMIETALARS